MKKIIIALVALLTLSLAFSGCSLFDTMEILTVDDLSGDWVEKAKWSGTEECTVSGDSELIEYYKLEEYTKEVESIKVKTDELKLIMAFDGFGGIEATVYANPLRTKLKIETITKYSNSEKGTKAKQTLVMDLKKD